jgi:hypothetical protein
VFAGGVSFETNGVYPELRAMFDSFDPHQVDGTSWYEAYRRVAPHPDAWAKTLSPCQKRLADLLMPIFFRFSYRGTRGEIFT